MRILTVVGARPNLVKTAPVVAALRRRRPDWPHVLVHTGQHYDRMLSQVFIDELGVPAPDHSLGVGSASHAVQTGRIMELLEPVMESEAPDLVIVPGDVNSTLAATLVAAKLCIPIAHLEAGLRSFDRSMPEEVNRIVADEFAELLFVHSDEAVANLSAEGIGGDRIHFVGNTMIDTLVAMEPRFRAQRTAERLGLDAGEYLLVTLHRPALVDGPLLGSALDHLGRLAGELPVVFPVHPRTRDRIGAYTPPPGLNLIDPIGYLDFLSLQSDAAAVLTDSGGVQEEATYLGVPCFTLRASTERPVTVRCGTNSVIGLDPARIAAIPGLLGPPGGPSPGVPPLWDGRASERVVDVLERGEG
jgi:UDP-N-acetylglucosamine 2-epimerase (non-hydrolysing)